LQIKTKIVSCPTANSKPVKQEVNVTVILPPLVFPDLSVKTLLFLDSKMLTKLNFGSCEELRAHGVDIPGYFTIAGAATYCPGWSK